jgi:DNA-binding NarL/FixJ family response regulator
MRPRRSGAILRIAMALRSLIVDDNTHFLTAARDLLERQGMEIVGVASSGAEALQLAGELRPDVALVDIDLGEESGLDLARRMAGTDAGRARVILISAYSENDFADLIAASPAVGFLSKADLSKAKVEELLRMGQDRS